ncbi:ComEA family DNA-binding protein [Suttonella ornithocola]|uniref:ComE operon protein 1 n=1 Tax=Suttonella ornithocola TaxID=279832 RepID=A0A380MRH5_9GAMM|nr:ComEA family DNA-binding protein [Suttonella ornithocola]SUO94888.1 ComE operon protein 1 [Suttonella ornithocola]SUO94949.1 ComE operon protein 1 [Suttonella ornithocola]
MKKFFCLVLALISTTIFAKININTATVDELVLLKGIGESKAKSIVEYREENGQFSSVADLAKVKGIGNKIVEKLSSDLTVDEETDLSNLENRVK